MNLHKLITLHQVDIEEVNLELLTGDSQERDLHSGHSHNDKYSHNFYSNQDDYDDEVSKAVIVSEWCELFFVFFLTHLLNEFYFKFTVEI